jgi:hypothetical protein
MQRRATIAERMTKLGGSKFGPVNPVQLSGPTQSVEKSGTGESAAGSGLPVPEEEENEGEQARRQRIAAKITGMGGMRFGLLPTQPSIAPVSTPPPSIPVRLEEEATPRSPRRDIVPPRQSTAYYHESEQEYEQPSSSDYGVQVEAEESELEEVGHGNLEDGNDNGGVKGDKDFDVDNNEGVDGETPVYLAQPAHVSQLLAHSSRRHYYPGQAGPVAQSHLSHVLQYANPHPTW